jgi:dihydropteroate synthase
MLSMITKPKLVGILNITPDSFSDGGDFLVQEKALIQAKKLLSDGADMIDVGGESTRPGAKMITPEEEWNRIKNVIKKLLQTVPAEKISLDTKNWRTAHKFLSLGGKIINDVSGGIDPRMHETIAKFDGTMIVNHFPGKNLAEVHEQKISSIEKVKTDLLKMKEVLIRAGIAPQKIILDPGIGFGKTMELNAKLLKFGSVLPNEKIYLGYSRKRFLGADRFEIKCNLEAAQVAIGHGVDYLRVHDVLAHKNWLDTT